LVEGVDLEYISLGDCPALRAIGKIDRMQMLYNISLVGIEILDLQICLSRFCIAARVMALRREISGEL